MNITHIKHCHQVMIGKEDYLRLSNSVWYVYSVIDVSYKMVVSQSHIEQLEQEFLMRIGCFRDANRMVETS